jgi:hypothetical protein
MCLLLAEKTKGCGRTVPEHEILSAIRFAKGCAWIPKDSPALDAKKEVASESFPSAPAPVWPKPDLVRIREIVESGWREYDLWERSPVRFEDDGSHAEETIDVLFPGDPLLCCGKTNEVFATRRRKIWRGHLASLPLIVPNPMLTVKGYTQQGTISEHTKEATARRIYLVVEFDFSEFARDGGTETEWALLVRDWRAAGISVADACASLHLHLATLRPLLLVVHSGGKSLHGWYPAFDVSDLQLRPFMDYAVQLGADRATWCRSQFVRMPFGTRENGLQQTTFYFDPTKAVNL